MKNQKKTPSKQLEKFSNIFTQLGLVLVLFIVYLTLEYQTEQKSIAFIPEQDNHFVFVEPDQEIVFKKEVKTLPKIEVKQAQKLILDHEIKKADDKAIETIIETTNENSIPLNPDDIIEVKIPNTDPIIETVPFINIENAPVFKGCEGLSKQENKVCFDKKMKEFVQRNFNTEIATEIGLGSGIHRIQTQFVIDNQGNIVDVQIRAPHIKLKNETNKMIQKLPKFTPGKQQDKPVKVKYTLPITFRVE